MSDLHDNVSVLISEEKLKARIEELGRQITEQYADKDLVLVGVLKGCFLLAYFLIMWAESSDLRF